MKKIIAGWVCWMLVLGSVFVVGANMSEKNGINSIGGESPTYTPHSPIRIDGDGDFAVETNGVANWDDPAAGTVANPWIIEDWDINGTGFGYCIYIGNTTDYFVVRNCSLHEASGVGTIPFWPNTGMVINNATNGKVFNNTVPFNEEHGILISGSDGNNLIEKNVITNNNQGIWIISSDNNTVINNTALNNNWGISLSSLSNNNTISKNTVTNNSFGIRIESCDNNTIVNNTLYSNTNVGIAILTSHNNKLFHNTFIKNLNQAGDDTTTNFWNASYPIGGNYWDDFDEEPEGAYDYFQGPNQDAGGADGIVDSGPPAGGWNPYNILGGAQDIYPLMFPTVELTTVTDTTPDNGETNVIVVQPYIIEFSKQMNTTFFPDIQPTPPSGGSWAWDNTSMWCNYTGGPGPGPNLLWASSTKYWVNLTDFIDADYLPLGGDTSFNFTIDAETPVVYNVSGAPLANVSFNNPMGIHANITESGVLFLTSVIIMREAVGNATRDNYTWLDRLPATPNPTLPNEYTVDTTWNATSGYGIDPFSNDETDAGYLTNGTEQDYLEIQGWTNGTGQWNMGVDVYFTNGTWVNESAELQLRTDGTPFGLWINGSGQEEWVDPMSFDYNMTIIPRVEIISFYKSNGTLASSIAVTEYGKFGHEFALPDVYFVRDHLVPSDEYPWLVLAVDGGINMGYNVSDYNVSVDNIAPTATSTPADVATNVTTAAANYTIHFSEPMNSTFATPFSDLPNITWAWSPDETWLNGSYNELEGGKEYYINLNNCQDYAKNPLSDDERIRNFTTGKPWATVTSPTSTGTNNNTPTITYDYGNNATEVVIYFTTDGGDTWDAWVWDDTVDGIMVPADSIGWSGTYHWSAQAMGSVLNAEEPVPSSPDDIECGPYVIDMDEPQVESTTPGNWDFDINRSASTYVIEFTEPMDKSEGTVDTTLPGVDSWDWDNTGMWLNGSYDDLAPETTYYVNLTGFADPVGNELTGFTEFEFRSERGPWADAGDWVPPDGSTNPRPWISYSLNNRTTSVEIYYTDDSGTTWTLWGEDTDVNETWIPDTDLPAPGTYNWNARGLGYIDEPVPSGAQSIESGDYVLLAGADAPSVVSTTPADSATGVGLNADIYVIHFSKAMDSSDFPESNLPAVTWTWSTDKMWLNGSYNALTASTEYHVNLTGFNCVDGLYLTGDTYKTFTTRSADEPGTGTIIGQVTDEDGNPIAGATVMVEGTDITATTNETGWYILEDVPEGTHTLEITHPDYGTQEVNVTVTEGETETAATGQLPPPTGDGGAMDWTWIIIILVIVVVIVVVAVALMMKRGGRPPKMDETPDQEPEEPPAPPVEGDKPSPPPNVETPPPPPEE